MSHESGRDQIRHGAGQESRSGPDEPDPPTSTDHHAPRAGKSDRDRRGGDTNSEVSAARSAVGSADDAIEAEIVEDGQKRLIESVISSAWSGALPHPDDAERYERLSPGTLDRLMAIKERQMSVAEHEMRISEKREDTIRCAVDAEADVKRSLAHADAGALKRGQFLSWTISTACIVTVAFGLWLGYPQAVWGIIVPALQAGTSLIRTVSQPQSGRDARKPSRTQSPGDGDETNPGNSEAAAP